MAKNSNKNDKIANLQALASMVNSRKKPKDPKLDMDLLLFCLKNLSLADSMKAPEFLDFMLNRVLEMPIGFVRSLKDRQAFFSVMIKDWNKQNSEDKQISEYVPNKFDKFGTPSKIKSPNTPITNALLNLDDKGEIIDAGEMALPVFGNTVIIVNATLENSDKVQIKGEKFTENDRGINDVCTTFRELALKKGLNAISITPDMIYRAWTGKTRKDSVSPQQRQMVIDSVEKQSHHIRLWANLTDEMKSRNIVINPNGKTDEEKYGLILDDFILRATTLRNARGDIIGWTLNEDSPGTKYAKLNGQMLTIPTEMLSIKEVKDGEITSTPIPYTETRTAIVTYLTRRIEVMRHDEKEAKRKYNNYMKRKQKKPDMEEKTLQNFRKQTHTILFETAFKSAGIKNQSRKTENKKYIIQVFEFWKENGDISGFNLRKKGKSFDAVIVEL